jgi:PQQ-like domain
MAGAKPAHAEPRLAFRFSASATLFARPGVGPSGIYIGSGDGYVHALSPEGAYRWSYSVKGRVTAPPLEDPKTGRVFVVTSEARLYALEPDSHLRWVFPLPVPAKTELSLSATGTLYFVGQDDHLYGVTTGGALSLRLAASGARSAPVQLESGGTALLLGGALATLKGYGYERASLEALAPGGVLGGRLALGPDRAVFACEKGLARAFAGARVELSVASDCLAPPTRGQGFFAVAEANNRVRLFYPSGETQSVRLDATPLRPVWDAARQRLVVAASTGSVSAFDLVSEP